MEKTAEEIKAESEAIEKAKNDAQATNLNNELLEARKKAAQAEMRANQLENEKKERERLEEEARNKALQENNEYKTLYEKEKELRERIEAERQAEIERKAVEDAKKSVFSEFSSEVIEIAEATGISLSDDSDEAKEELKAKLEVISSKIPTANKKVVGNNGMTQQITEPDRAGLVERMRFSDPKIAREARQSLISKLPVMDEIKAAAGLAKK